MSGTIFSMPRPQPKPWAERRPDPAQLDPRRVFASGEVPPPVEPARAPVRDAAPEPDPATARRDLLERGAAEVSRARRYERPLALISLAGRAAGADDAVVEDAMRDVLDGATRVGADIVVRTGPAAFACLLPETNLSGAMHLAARIQRTARDLRVAREPEAQEPGHDGGGGIATRIGFAALTDDDRTFAAILSRAQVMLSDRPATR